MKNALGFVKGKSKAIVVSMMVSMMAVLSAVSASATDGTGTATAELESAFSTALANIQTDIFKFIGLALPVGLAIFGLTIAVKKGVNFVRGLIGRS